VAGGRIKAALGGRGKRRTQRAATRGIRKKIVTDEAQQPVAVQIDYADWLKIERVLNLRNERVKRSDLSRYAGVISLTEEPLSYQARVRNEWS
jgi:hypothetical protein